MRVALMLQLHCLAHNHGQQILELGDAAMHGVKETVQSLDAGSQCKVHIVLWPACVHAEKTAFCK